eukprot:TRINITY_DN11225_c0_g1_i1.p1 TRINITY_DN11225_c0_g1~~TRINITY_DN11225_c0_g1_i1.p1  ORF type:complete len:124 (-),score=28.85 TRINITY_DN11225_c0_g1_i1:11-382(-)
MAETFKDLFCVATFNSKTLKTQKHDDPNWEEQLVFDLSPESNVAATTLRVELSNKVFIGLERQFLGCFVFQLDHLALPFDGRVPVGEDLVTQRKPKIAGYLHLSIHTESVSYTHLTLPTICSV